MSEPLPHIDPKRTALLAMDFQAGIVGRSPVGQAAVEQVAKAIEIARDAGVTIGYVRVALDDMDFASVPDRNKAFTQFAAHAEFLDVNGPTTAIVDAIAPQPGDVVVRKVRFGAFSTTNLDHILRGRGIDTLILSGLSTSGVVLSTVRDAADLDYRIFVLADCCGDQDPEVHNLLVNKVFPRQAYVIELADLDGLLG